MLKQGREILRNDVLGYFLGNSSLIETLILRLRREVALEGGLV